MSFNEELIRSMEKTAEANRLLNHVIEYNTTRTQKEWLANPQKMDYFNNALPSVRFRAVRKYNKKLKELTQPKKVNIED